MRFLRKNTAAIVTVGPFYDKTDGVTIETALTITNERITLVADTDDGNAPTNILDNVTGATSGTDNDLNYITGNDAGMMQLELTAANTNRNGRLLLSITDAANHVPVFHEFLILPEAVYDALVLGTDTLTADVTQFGGSNGTFSGGRPEVNTTHVAGTAQTAGDLKALLDAIDNFVDTEIADIQSRLPAALVGGRMDSNVQAMANGVIAAATFAAQAIDAAACATDFIGANELSNAAAAKIWTQQLTEAYAAKNAAPTGAQFMFMLLQMLTEFAIATTTLTVNKLDQSTAAMTFTLDDASNPTSLTRAS